MFTSTIFESKTATKGIVNQINSSEELCEKLHTSIFSPFIYKDGIRGKKNFLETNILMLDIDGGTTSAEVQKRLDGYKHIITFTKSHRKEKNGVIADRMRIVFFLDQFIREEKVYKQTWKKAQKLLPEIDPQCCDLARFYFPSVKDANDRPIIKEGKLFEVEESSNNEGKPFSVETSQADFQEILRSITSKDRDVKNFEENCHTGLAGQFNRLLNKTAFLCAANGATQEDFISYFNPKCESPLDSTDLAVIESAFASGAKIKNLPWNNISFYVRNFIAAENIELRINGMLTMNKVEIKKESLINLIYEKALKEGIKKNAKPTIQSILSNWEDEEIKREINRVRAELKFDCASDDGLVKQWCEAITGARDQMTIAVIKHFLWQVKRKLNQKRVEWHMMPILFGKSGSGKTEAIRRLLAPIVDLVLETDLEAASDSRCDHNYERRYVFFIDELSRNHRADFSSIKRKITADTIEYRVLGGHTQNRIPNNATWIGTTNTPINDIIKDSSSVRRFFQIKALDKCDWDSINNIDYLALWKSIDELDPVPPVVPLLSEIAIEQEKFRHHELIEEWVIETGLIPSGDDKGKFISVAELAKHYRQWLEANNFKGGQTDSFVGRRLSNLLNQESMPLKGVRTYKVSSNYQPSNPVFQSTDSTDY